MATTLTIGGTTIDLNRTVALGSLKAFAKGGIPTLSFSRRGGPLPSTPDPYLGKEALLTINGTQYFRGDVVSAHPQYNDQLGWVVSYQCHGLRDRGDRFPHTDSATGLDSSGFNLTLEDPTYDSSRAGRTVGQILTAVLKMDQNVANLQAKSIGNITGTTGNWTLPTATVNDLAALTVIPPTAVSVGGEKFLGAIEGFLSEWAPNHMLHVEPGGNIRVLDTRAFSPHTFTMDTDPISPSELSRDWGDCFSRVVVRGQPVAVMALLKLSQGQLTEAFDHDGLTTAQAKSAWKVSDYHNPAGQKAQDSGTCTCPSTTTITLSSSASTAAYAANYWDQTATGRHGTINLSSTTATGLTQFWHARVVSSTAQSAAGGSFTVTIDAPLPHLNFDHYTLTGLQGGPSVVWTRYKIANSALWPKLTSQSTYPQPFVNAGGNVSLTSCPTGAVLWPISGSSAPYNQFPLPFTFDTTTGYITFALPTYVVANNAAPSDVWVLIPYWQSSNQAVAPANDGSGNPQYAGTAHTVEGLSDTLTVTAHQWRDPAQLSQMQAYAADLLDSVKNTVIEGTVVYHGLMESALVPGMAANVTGSAYTTGWESVNLPVVECDLTWNPAGPTSWTMTLHATNRKAHYTASRFLSPEQVYVPIGADVQPFGPALLGLGQQPINYNGDLSGYASTPGQEPYSFPTSGADLGLPSGPADLGLPTSPGDYLASRGAPLPGSAPDK